MLLAGLLALTLLAIAALTRPWWRRLPEPSVARRAANIAAYRSRLAEIEREAEAGLIPADAAETMRTETAARLLGDTDGLLADDRMRAGSARWPAVLIAVLVTAFAGIAYWQGGSWRQLQQIESPQARADDAPLPPQVQAMVAQLEARLKSHPDDAEGWSMLGRSYFVMHRYLQAADAYHQANTHNGGRDAETLSGEGEALAFANGSEVPPEAAALFDRALDAQADFGPALWYGGLADAQSGNFGRARQRWALLRQQSLPAQMQALVDREMKELDQVAGSTPMASAAPAAAPAGAAPAAAASVVSVHLTVKLAPALAGKVPANAQLFVFAKADGGPPMPLAVSRQPVSGWPVQLTLDDSMAMAPSLRLSSFDRYVITARVSASGQAMAQTGDLQGSLHLSRAQADKPVVLEIDSVVP